MSNLSREVLRYINLPERRKLEVIEAGEDYGCDPAISETLVPNIRIYVPTSFIRRYNLATKGRKSRALPDPDMLWKDLRKHLAGKDLRSRNEFESEVSVDEAIREMMRWPHGSRYDISYGDGVVLVVKAAYDPYDE